MHSTKKYFSAFTLNFKFLIPSALKLSVKTLEYKVKNLVLCIKKNFVLGDLEF